MHHTSIVVGRGPTRREVEIRNYLGKRENDMASDVERGLSSPRKYLPSKYFYDERGSKLFEDICRLDEYYLTRTELSILKESAGHLIAANGHQREIVELGSGGSLKIRTLLDAAGRSACANTCYCAVDINEAAVAESLLGLIRAYPQLSVTGVVADFTQELAFLPTEKPAVICFLGSTIGNLDEEQSVHLLANIVRRMKAGDSLAVGFDMVKPKLLLEAAYNDLAGVTAQFNKNVLNVVNSELDGDLDPRCFDHLAFLNGSQDRIEMHLRANRHCSFRIKAIDMEVSFEEGETIHTENSRKYTRDAILGLASRSGLTVKDWHADSRGWFSLVEMVPKVSDPETARLCSGLAD